MSGIQVKRIGRLMALLWPILIIIANTSWLMNLIVPSMTDVTYGNGYKRDFFIPVAISGEINFLIHQTENYIKARTTQNKKGAIISVNFRVNKGNYKHTLGIA